MTILFRDVETNKLKEERATKIIPCIFHAEVTFENGRIEMIPLKNIYDISAE